MPEGAVSAHSELKKLFGKSGILHRIRNGFSYHYPDAEMLEAAFESASETEDYSWYVTSENITSFYFGCEMIIGHGSMSQGEGADMAGKMKMVLNTTVQTANAMTDFLAGLLSVMVDEICPNGPRRYITEKPCAPGAEAAMLFYYSGLLDGRLDAVNVPKT